MTKRVRVTLPKCFAWILINTSQFDQSVLRIETSPEIMIFRKLPASTLLPPTLRPDKTRHLTDCCWNKLATTQQPPAWRRLWTPVPRQWRHLRGLRILDVGCSDLLTEALARLGAQVVDVDSSPGNIAAARLHAQSQNVTVDYRLGEPAVVMSPQERFDVVLALDVV